MKVTLKIGGHVFPFPPVIEMVNAYAEVITGLVEEGHSVLAVAGGGEAARKYIAAARMTGADEATCDQIGIEISRLNALLLVSKLGAQAYPEVPTTLNEVRRFHSSGKVVVVGGLSPGHSTTAVGALVAEATRSDIYIISSDVDGIYTADPKVDRSAKKLDEVTTREVLEMALAGRCWAGTYALDPIAVKVVERSRIPTYFINGLDPLNARRVVEGRRIGTQILTHRDTPNSRI
ncbi:MAG: UMP kinase [Candidatus Bathyarchaeia archaeon]